MRAMYCAIIPTASIVSEKPIKTTPTIVPNPAKGTPLNIQIKEEIMVAEIEIVERINPIIEIKVNGVVVCERIALIAHFNVFLIGIFSYFESPA
jgi:hypothetical protein